MSIKNQLSGGTVFKPRHQSKNYKWRAEVWNRDKPDDKKHTTSKNFRTKKEAEEWLANQLKRYAKRTISADPDITVAGWLEFSLDEFFINLRPSTRTSYEEYFTKKVGTHPIGVLKLVELNVCDCQKFENDLLQKYKPKTVRSIMLAIRKGVRFAIGAGIIDKNPLDYIVLPKVEEPEVEFLNLDELKLLADTAKNEPWGIFFPLGLLSACRIGELAALRKSSVHYENGQYFLSVEGSLSRVKDYAHEGKNATILKIGPTKNGKTRQIPLLPDMVSAIKLHLAKQETEAINLYGKPVEDPFLFSCDGGLHFVDPSTLRNWSKRIAECAGFRRRFTPHMLRKSLATLGANCSGVNVKDVSAILGNGFQVCADHYVASTLTTKAATMQQFLPLCEQLFS